MESKTCWNETSIVILTWIVFIKGKEAEFFDDALFRL